MQVGRRLVGRAGCARWAGKFNWTGCIEKVSWSGPVKWAGLVGPGVPVGSINPHEVLNKLVGLG